MLAGQVGVVDELAEKFRKQRDEVEKTLITLKALRDRKVTHFVFVGNTFGAALKKAIDATYEAG